MALNYVLGPLIICQVELKDSLWPLSSSDSFLISQSCQRSAASVVAVDLEVDRVVYSEGRWFEVSSGKDAVPPNAWKL